MPRLTADNMRVLLEQRWSPIEDPNRRRGLDEVCEMWNEWIYAFAKAGYRLAHVLNLALD